MSAPGVNVDELAERVAALLLPQLQATVVSVLERQAQLEPVQMVDAAELARILCVGRDYVYEHAVELGAERLSGGPRGRLRFDVEVARAAIARSAGKTSQTPESAEASGDSAPPRRGRRARSPVRRPKPGSVLQVKGGRASRAGTEINEGGSAAGRSSTR